MFPVQHEEQVWENTRSNQINHFGLFSEKI